MADYTQGMSYYFDELPALVVMALSEQIYSMNDWKSFDRRFFKTQFLNNFQPTKYPVSIKKKYLLKSHLSAFRWGF